MIAQVRGTLISRSGEEAVVDVGGVGISVQVTARTAAGLEVGSTVTLITQLVVREDSLTLYGFLDAAEREVFLTVQTVSGIGPRLAMTMLATLTAEQIREAIATEDERLLTTVSGLGRKSAQRLIVDLKDKLGAAAVTFNAAAASPVGWRGQVTAALTGLGWSPQQAHEAVATVSSAPESAGLTVPEALRLALQSLDHAAAVGR